MAHADRRGTGRQVQGGRPHGAAAQQQVPRPGGVARRAPRRRGRRAPRAAAGGRPTRPREARRAWTAAPSSSRRARWPGPRAPPAPRRCRRGGAGRRGRPLRLRDPSQRAGAARRRHPRARPNTRVSTTSCAVPMRLTTRCPSRHAVGAAPAGAREFDPCSTPGTGCSLWAWTVVPGPATEGRNVREVFQQELHEVQERLVRIADLVADAIDKATTAFNGQDVTLAESVIADDHLIDDLAAQPRRARHRHPRPPAAGRARPAGRRERAAHQRVPRADGRPRRAHRAARRATASPRRWCRRRCGPRSRSSAGSTCSIARKLTRLLETEDSDLAEEIRNDDDLVDELHLSVFDKVLGETWKGAASDTVDATLASRYHERFADHAVSIAKKVQYLQTGAWVARRAAPESLAVTSRGSATRQPRWPLVASSAS